MFWNAWGREPCVEVAFGGDLRRTGIVGKFVDVTALVPVDVSTGAGDDGAWFIGVATGAGDTAGADGAVVSDALVPAGAATTSAGANAASVSTCALACAGAIAAGLLAAELGGVLADGLQPSHRSQD